MLPQNPSRSNRQSLIARARADAAVGPRDLGCDPIGDRIEELAIALEITVGVVPGADQERGLIEREVVAAHHLAEPTQARG